VNRFEKILFGPQPDALDSRTHILHPGHHDDGGFGPALADISEHFNPGTILQKDIQQDDIETLRLQCLPGRNCVVDSRHAVIPQSEHLRHLVAELGLVIQNQNL